MKITLKIVAVCFLLFSCKKSTNDLKEKPDKKAVLIEQKGAQPDKEEIAKDDVKIQFSDLTVLIKDIDGSWKDENNINDNIYETKQDTAFFYLYPGFVIENSFKIDQAVFDEIELYGQTEIKLGINTEQEIEVPFCVLEDFKSYTSKWRKLKINRNDLKFEMIDDKTNNPINFAIDELKLAVEKNCGTEWLDEIRNIESIDKLPVTFFTTRYIYKIKVKNSKTNQIIEKYIVFYTPVSC